MPSVVLRERPECPSTQVVSTRVPGGITRERFIESFAIIDERLGWCAALLGLQRRFDELDSEPDLEMPFDVAVCVKIRTCQDIRRRWIEKWSERRTHEPDTGVVRSEAERRTSSRRDHDCITTHRVRVRFIDRDTRRRVVVLLHDLELVAVKLKAR